jgi:hypothetical protein
MEIVHRRLECLEGKERMHSCPWHKGMDVWQGWPGRQASMFLMPGGPWFQVSLQSPEMAAKTLKSFGHVEIIVRGGSLALSHMVLHSMVAPNQSHVSVEWYTRVIDLSRLDTGCEATVPLMKLGRPLGEEMPVVILQKTAKVNTLGRGEEGRLYSIWLGDPLETTV